MRADALSPDVEVIKKAFIPSFFILKLPIDIYVCCSSTFLPGRVEDEQGTEAFDSFDVADDYLCDLFGS